MSTLAWEADDPPDEGEDLLHGPGPADDVVEAHAAGDLFAQARHLRAQGHLAERLLDDQHELLDLEGLGDVVEGAQLDRPDGGVDGSEGGDGDDVGGGMHLAHLAQQVEPIEVRHLDVRDHQVDAALLDPLDARPRAAGGLDPEALVLQLLAQVVAHGGVVVDHQDHRAGLRRAARAGPLTGRVRAWRWRLSVMRRFASWRLHGQCLLSRAGSASPLAVTVSAGASVEIGRNTRNTAPPSGRSSTSIHPSWSLTMPLATASPSPVPSPVSLVVKKASKILSRSALGTPVPVSPDLHQEVGRRGAQGQALLAPDDRAPA